MSRSRIYSVIRAQPARPQDPLLSKKIGRWPSQIFHTLHKTNPACAAGVSLISAVQHYKGSFRHDFYVPPKSLWGNALYVYVHYILPYMDYINVESVGDSPPGQDLTREDSEEKPEHRQGVVMGTSVSSEEDRTSVVLSPPQHISMDKITQLHRALFSNIRKKRKRVHALSDTSGRAGDCSSTSTASYSSWFWSTTPEKTGGSRTSSPAPGNGRDNNKNENDIHNTDYEVLDCSIKPDVNMYDEIVDSIYQKFSEKA